ncbi:MAG: hypothetical protein KAI79_04835 [Bacteroidales bacterium]|nr:hypothetical protein [Bacteroidales bacterium]
MNLKLENTIAQVLRIVFAIPLGLWAVNYFKIDNSAYKMIYFFGVYILVSIIIEIFRKIIENLQEQTNHR